MQCLKKSWFYCLIIGFSFSFIFSHKVEIITKMVFRVLLAITGKEFCIEATCKYTGDNEGPSLICFCVFSSVFVFVFFWILACSASAFWSKF